MPCRNGTCSMPQRVLWAPQPDITLHELAMCLPLVTNINQLNSLRLAADKIPAGCERHFRVVNLSESYRARHGLKPLG